MLKKKFSKETLESMLLDIIDIYEEEEDYKLIETIDKVYTLYEQEIETLDKTTTFIK